MSAGTWTVAEAKAKFSEVVHKARVSGPQMITKNGRTAVVIVSAEKWERKTRRRGNLAEFFAESPLQRLRSQGSAQEGCSARDRPMNFLLDTNVVLEWAKPRPDTGVMAWLAEADEDRVFISVITLAELRHGIEKLPAGGEGRTKIRATPKVWKGWPSGLRLAA